MNHTEEHILNTYMKFKTYDEFIEANIHNYDGYEGYAPHIKILSDYIMETFEYNCLPCAIKCMFTSDAYIYGEEAVMMGIHKLLTHDFKTDYECVGEDSVIYGWCETNNIVFEKQRLEEYIKVHLAGKVGITMQEMFKNTRGSN